MDCGKSFTAVINSKTREPINCWYYGEIDTNDIKYSIGGRDFDIFIMELENGDEWKEFISKIPLQQRLLKYLFEWYASPYETRSDIGFWKQLELKIRHIFDKHMVEMWVCPECRIEAENREENRDYDTE